MTDADRSNSLASDAGRDHQCILSLDEAEKLWDDVACRTYTYILDRRKTVLWKQCLPSLECAHHYMFISVNDREFIDNCMERMGMVLNLLREQPWRIDQMEKRTA